MQVVTPPVSMSSSLLYIFWTFQVLAPTVIVPVLPLQMSPFSLPEALSYQAFSWGSEIISENSCEVTWVCRCSWVSARWREQLLSFAQLFLRQVSLRPGTTE